MFKSEFKVSANYKLSSKDVKDLCRRIQEELKSKELEKTVRDSETISIFKQTMERTTVYMNNDGPLLIDLNGNQLMPCLLSLNVINDLSIERVQININVERFLINGANLMWQGVSNFKELRKFSIGGLAAVFTNYNVCVAIGTFMASKTMVEDLYKVKGPAVAIVHVFGDKLSEFYSDNKLRSIIEGRREQYRNLFKKTAKLLDELVIEDKDSSKSLKSDTNPEIKSSEEVETVGKNSKVKKCQKPVKEVSGPQKVVPPSDCLPVAVDQNLLELFLKSIKHSQSSIQLPMEISLLWNTWVIKYRVPGVDTDIKKSSYKKLSSFLSFYEIRVFSSWQMLISLIKGFE